MNRSLTQRGALSALGALAGSCLYALSEVIRQGLLQDRLALAVAAFGAVFFFGLLAMAGPVRMVKAAGLAAVTGAVTAGLLVLASLRFSEVEQMFRSPLPVFAAMILATLPLPFFIAAEGPGWRNYPVLFTESWGVVVRYAAAGLFMAVVWALILLSDALFGILGLTFIEDLLNLEPVPFVISGAVLGLGLAVVMELSDLISPYLLLRLMRLLLPFVLLVMAVFVLALPVQGLSGLFGGLSVAAVLLAITGAAATLVTVAVDHSDEEAVQGRLMPAATRAMAALMPVFAVLAGWAVWLRVDQYGWSPTRLFAALAAFVALGYGALYFAAILAPTTWKARIRTSNIAMALLFLVLAAAWLSVLNPQAISSRSQLARFESGVTPVARLDTDAFAAWGLAGERALAQLREQATQPGSEALALRLKGVRTELSPEQQRARLRVILPVRPASETTLRDQIIRDTADYRLSSVLQACETPMTDGRPGCILAVGDFWTDTPGAEAILLLLQSGGFAGLSGYVSDGVQMKSRQVTGLASAQPQMQPTEEMIRAIADSGPALTPVPRNRLSVNGIDLLIGE